MYYTPRLGVNRTLKMTIFDANQASFFLPVFLVIDKDLVIKTQIFNTLRVARIMGDNKEKPTKKARVSVVQHKPESTPHKDVPFPL